MKINTSTIITFAIFVLLGLSLLEVTWGSYIPARWGVGDTVCLSQSGKPATVRWWNGGVERLLSSEVYRPPQYTLVTVDNLGRTYEVIVSEHDVMECLK